MVINLERKTCALVVGEVSTCFQVLFLYSIWGNKVHTSIMKIGKAKRPVIWNLSINNLFKKFSLALGETRVVSLGFTYNFSKGKKIAPVKRTQGSANEEQNRIGQ